MPCTLYAQYDIPCTATRLGISPDSCQTAEAETYDASLDMPHRSWTAASAAAAARWRLFNLANSADVAVVVVAAVFFLIS